MSGMDLDYRGTGKFGAYTVVVDSGKREEFKTGSVRDTWLSI